MRHIDTYNKFLNENLLTKKNFKYNYNEWESGESNILLVCGYSGSGKSTFARKEAKIKGAIYIELDNLYMTNDNGDYLNTYVNTTLWKKFSKVTKHKKLLESNGMLKDSTLKHQPSFLNVIDAYLLFRINYAVKDKKNKYVLEGIQLCYVSNGYDLFSKHPILIIATGVIKSSIRASLRNYRFSKKHELSNINIFKHLYQNFKHNLSGIDSHLTKFKKYLKNANRK